MSPSWRKPKLFVRLYINISLMERMKYERSVICWKLGVRIYHYILS